MDIHDVAIQENSLIHHNTAATVEWRGGWNECNETADIVENEWEGSDEK